MKKCVQLILDVCATKSLGLCCNSSSMEKPGCKHEQSLPTWKQDMTSFLCKISVSFTGFTHDIYKRIHSLPHKNTLYIYNISIYKCKKLHWRLLLSFHTDQSLLHLGEPQLMMAFTIRTLPWLYWLQPLEGVFLGRETAWCIWAWYRYSDYTYEYARINIQIYI